MGAKIWIITAETVHNWRNRAQEWAAYYGDLPIVVHNAIGAAHDRHQNEGASASECVVELTAHFPCLEAR